jgi:hypothetical protein
VINAPVSSGGAANIDVEGGILILAGRFITTPGSTTTKTGPGFLTISGQQFHSGSFIASAGSTQFDSDATNLALVANSTVSFGSSQHLLSLRVGAGATTTLNPNGNRVLVTQTISLEPSAKLDLKDNDLIVNQGNFTQIRTDVLAGFGNNPGITSSTSDGSQVLALFDNSLVGAADFNGEPLGASALTSENTPTSATPTSTDK